MFENEPVMHLLTKLVKVGEHLECIRHSMNELVVPNIKTHKM